MMRKELNSKNSTPSSSLTSVPVFSYRTLSEKALAFLMPLLLTIEKICGAYLLFKELRMKRGFDLFQESTLFEPTVIPDDYKGRIISVDTGVYYVGDEKIPFKYNNKKINGVEILSAFHFIWSCLGMEEILTSLFRKSQGDSLRARYIKAFKKLLNLMNWHNQSGKLKAPAFSIPFLCREARKIHEWLCEKVESKEPGFRYDGKTFSPISVLQRTFHTVEVWIEREVHHSSENGRSIPPWVRKMIEEFAGGQEARWTVGEYITNMFYCGVEKSEMKRYAEWWAEMQEWSNIKAEEKYRELEAILYADGVLEADGCEKLYQIIFKDKVDRIPWIAKKFFFGKPQSDGSFSYMGLLIRSDDEDLVRAAWKFGVSAVIAKKLEGDWAVLTKKNSGIDLSGFIEAVEQKLIHKGFYESKINAYLIGSGNWPAKERDTIRIDSIQKIFIENIVVPAIVETPIEVLSDNEPSYSICQSNSTPQVERKVKTEVIAATKKSGLKGISEEKANEWAKMIAPLLNKDWQSLRRR